MAEHSHDTMVAAQFSPRAAAYVASAVHARGEDLEQLVEIVRGRREARVLDLGCGGGHVGFHVAPEVGEVIACDLSPEMLEAVAGEAARRGIGNLVTRRGAAEDLPFESGEFDVVLSRYSAHHWRDFAAGLGEARRVLRPGGLAVFIDAVSPGPALLDTALQAIELLRDPSHVRNYSVEEWRRALAEAGFAPGATTRRRVRLEFKSWVERMRTPPAHVEAIRSLQRGASDEVRRHFAIEPDGSFMLDTASFEAAPR